MKRLHQIFDRNLILLFVLSLFALAPLLSPGYFFDAHDADHSVFFLVEFDKAIRDGILWPRWGPDHAMGYGYPIWIVYAPLAYFVAEGFHLLGLGLTAAVKATAALAFVAGGWGMFVLLRRWLGRGPAFAGTVAALVGGLVYVYAPYHLLTIYVRAAFAEFCAMAWFPWVLLAFSDLVDASGDDKRSPRTIGLAALALAGLVLTHTGTILVFAPFLTAYLAFALVRRAIGRSKSPPEAEETRGAAGPWRDLGQAILRVAAAGLLAGGLAAIFLLPALTEQRYILQESWLGNTYNYNRHFVFPSQFLDTFWGYGYSDDPAGPNDGMSFQLGVVGVALALTAAAGLFLRTRGRPGTQRSTTAFFLVALLATLFVMTPWARPVWDSIGLLAILQFPWRLLSLASLCVAVLSGAAVASLVAPAGDQPDDGTPDTAGAGRLGQPQASAALVISLAAVLASFPVTLPQYTGITPIDESAQSIIRFESAFPDMIGLMAATEQPFSESPLTEQYRSGQPLQKAAVLDDAGQVRMLDLTSASVVVQATLDSPATVVFYTYDFPGWRATVDGEPVAHRTHPPYGLIAVDVPAGDHTVAIRFGTTPPRTAGAILSIISLLIVVVLIVFGRRRRTGGGRSV